MSTSDVKAGTRLFDLLGLQSDGALLALHEQAKASLRLGQIDSEHAKVLGRKVSEWRSEDLARELEEALSFDPYVMLLAGWSKLRKVRQAIDKSRSTHPTAPQTVSLAKHEIDAKVEPSLVLSVLGVDCRAVKIGLTLKASFESAQLVFEQGRLMSVKTGKPTGTLTASVEGYELDEFKRSLAFEPSCRFQPPLALDFGFADLSGAP
jgi:hypothetical protein